MVVAVALLVWSAVGADQPGLALFDTGIGVDEVHAAGADRFDLRSGQHDAGLERLVDGVLVAGAAVENDVLLGHRSRRRKIGLWRGSEGEGAIDMERAGRFSRLSPRNHAKGVLTHRLGGGVTG